MFSFRKRGDEAEVHRLIRRLIDQSCPSIHLIRGESRWEDRSNRTLPVLLAPLDKGDPIVEESAYAVTKNLSGQGLAMVMPQPFWAEGVVIGLWNEVNPEFVRGEIRQNVPLGGGFWQLGVELVERLSLTTHPQLAPLVPLAMKLDPNSEAERPLASSDSP